MNAILPYGAHGEAAHAVRTHRDAEYDVLSRVTRLLRQAELSGNRSETIAAVDKNNQLWTLWATDLADPGNGLPADLKAGLLSLAGFGLRQGHAVLARGANLRPLIDINLSIMKGLRGEVEP